MKIREIADLLVKKSKGKVINMAAGDEEITNLLTDSRNYFNPESTLFFAIRTEGGNDGHKYIGELIEKGVRNFVVEYLPEDLKDISQLNLIVADNSVAALQETGASKRRNAKETVTIVGSRGKTTLKEILFQLMEPGKNISRSPRSYNSKIGVPLSLWQIPEETDIALIEAGISKRGEMETLSEAINPDTVIFTTLTEAHSQGFADDDEKAREKAIIAYNPGVKRVIYPLDNEKISNSLKDLKERVAGIRWSFHDPSAELYLTTKKIKGEQNILLTYRWQGKENSIELRAGKEYETENIASALAFMLSEGVEPEEIEKRFEKYHPIKTRLNVSEGVNGCSLILDNYTSDLSSLLPAVDFMKRRKTPKQTLALILSDLKHEGSNPRKTYEEISSIIKNAGIKKFIGVGATMEEYAAIFPEGSQFFKDTASLLENVSASDFNDEIILLKGSPDFTFESIFDRLEAKKHETVLEVNLDALLRNYNYFRKKIPATTGIVAMVKAAGYGAGSYETAKTLQDAGASYLAVAALDEGVELRNNGITMPIMIMNPKAANYRSLFKNRLEPVIYNISMLETLIKEAKNYGVNEYSIHIKLDTGMHRMGFEKGSLDKLKELLGVTGNIKVASIFSHLATADCPDMDDFTFLQLNRFEEMSRELIDSLGYPVKRHILNSAGILRFPEYHYDMVRLGIGLYGANTLPPEIEEPLAVVSTLRTVIIDKREVEEGEAVGYGRKGEIKGRRNIATLPIGYADGMNRKFGNGALKVLVNGSLAPTIGNICMDATMIDVTGIECREGDPVEIFGENISVQVLADTLETIPYEILTSVSPRVKRVYYRE